MKLVNNTHYYSLNNRTYNIIPDNDSWQFQSSKRLSYSQRLYWEYKYIRSCGGQAFFYTFTYNNKNLPYFKYTAEVVNKKIGKLEYIERKFPCFNYEHIRLLTNGIISKTLRRKYGSQLRYFVACERGEGKGFRGKGMNPHYHVIFFISPLPDKIRKPKDPPYKRISPIQFCHLCKCVWQYQSTPNKYDHLVADYKTARFGHCQPGDDCGLISDFDALSYVSKYVVKDTLQTSDDLAIKCYYERKFKFLGPTYHALYSYYWYLRHDGSISSKQDFLQYSGLDKFLEYRSITGNRNIDWQRYLNMTYPCDYDSFFADFNDYFNRLYLPAIVDQSYRNYCNTYGSKVRTSKSLGIYGLQFVKDVSTNPHFVLDKSDEVVAQPICLYYFRKLYMDIVRCPHTGNPLYVLNESGINLKCLFLKSSLDKLSRDVYLSLDMFNQQVANDSYRAKLYDNRISWLDYCSLVNNPDLADIVNRFVVYRFIYQYRHYDTFSQSPALNNGFTYDNYLSDYRYFLKSNYYTCDYSDMFLLTMLELKHSRFYLSFDSHSVFLSFIPYFKQLECFLDVYREFMSESKKRQFDESTDLRKRINAQKYSSVNS